MNRGQSVLFAVMKMMWTTLQALILSQLAVEVKSTF